MSRSLPSRLAGLGLVTALAGCTLDVATFTPQLLVNTTAPTAAKASVAPALAATAKPAPALVQTSISGTVLVPSAVTAAQGGQITQRRTLALDAVPLAGATVFLADANGNPIPHLASTKTDAHGHYSLPQAPAGYTFLIVAQIGTSGGLIATFQSLVLATPAGTTVNVDAASTLLSAAVVRDQSSSDLGKFDPASFETARAAAANALTPADLTGFTDRSEILLKANALVGRVAALAQFVTTLKADIKQLQQTLAELQLQLGSQAAPEVTATATAAVV